MTAEHLGHPDGARAVGKAIGRAVDEDKTIMLDLGGEAPTAEASDAVGSCPG